MARLGGKTMPAAEASDTTAWFGIVITAVLTVYDPRKQRLLLLLPPLRETARCTAGRADNRSLHGAGAAPDALPTFR